MARSPSSEYLVLDIETVPDDLRWTPPAPPPGDAPPRSNPSPFPPLWAHRIVVAGFAWLDHDYALHRFGVLDGDETGDPDARERALLDALSALIGRRQPILVTFNGRGFDLPVIALRALCHGVPLAWYYRDRNVRARYSEEGHLDLCDWLADHGAARSSSLDAITRLVGLPGKVGVDGSQVEGLYRAGELAAIQRYCLADVAQTALLFLRFRLLQGRLDPDVYRARSAALLDALGADGRVPEVVDGTDRGHLLGATPGS